MPEISVIVPVYKVEAYLNRCVDSILAQTYPDFELILVNDGSPDRCPEMCDTWARKDSRIHVIHQRNGGLSAARNAGIDWAFANSDSKWVTFVDSDDWVHNEYLEVLLRTALETDSAVSICEAIHTLENLKDEAVCEKPIAVFEPETAYVKHYEKLIIACAKLYRKELFRENCFPIGKLHEDAFTVYKVLFSVPQVAICDIPLYYYWQNPEGIMLSPWSLKRLDEVEAHEQQLIFLQKNGYKMALKREVLAYLRILARHIQCAKAAPTPYCNVVKSLRKRLKKSLFWIKRIDSYPVAGNEWVYEAAMPILMAVFWRFKAIKNRVQRGPYRNKLSVVCIAKNEGAYIKEWVDYHLLQGIDCIYLYDNESPDQMREILEPYIQSGKVIYTLLAGKGRQLDAYNDAVRKFRYKTKYMAFIDCDEFLVQEDQSYSLIDTIENIMKKNFRSGGIAVNWRMYGSSGFEVKPDGLVIENFLKRGNYDVKGCECIKTIANPRLVKEYRHVHFPTYYRGFFSVNEDGARVDGWSNLCEDTKYIRINHYFTKSKEEWVERRSKGKADTLDDTDKRTLEEFYAHDYNDIYDPIMLRYVDELKKKA